MTDDRVRELDGRVVPDRVAEDINGSVHRGEAPAARPARAGSATRKERFPIPSPEQLDRLLGDIEDDCRKLRDLWRWAHPDAFRRPKHGSRDVVSGGSTSDVADSVVATESFRTKIRHASREMVDARTRIHGAVADLNDALGLLDPPPGPEVADVRFLPHPADKGDVRRAQQAQSRRNARAAASGDYSEVTG